MRTGSLSITGNFPVIAEVRALGDATVITGDLLTRPNRAYRVEFFCNTRPDSSGFGEGESYLGSASVTTGETGSASFAFTASGISSNQYFTATGTDEESGDTSEFSQAVRELQMSIAITNSEVQLAFHSVTGRTYRLEANLQLGDPQGWLPVPDAENLNGTGGLLTFCDTLDRQIACRCYRLRVVP